MIRHILLLFGQSHILASLYISLFIHNAREKEEEQSPKSKNTYSKQCPAFSSLHMSCNVKFHKALSFVSIPSHCLLTSCVRCLIFKFALVVVIVSSFRLSRLSLTMFPHSLLGAQHSFESGTGQRTEPIKKMMIENSDGLEFFPLLIDYLRRKYGLDHKAHDKQHATPVMPYTRHLSLAQMHFFQQLCDHWIPGMFHNNAPLGFWI